MSNRLQLEREALGGLTYEGNYYTSELCLDDFKIESHRTIYEIIEELAKDGEPIDYTTIFKKAKFLGKSVDIREITSIHDEAGSSYTHGFHVKALKEYNSLEMLNTLGKEIALRSKKGEKSEELTESIENTLQSLANASTRARIVKVDTTIHKVIEGIEAAYKAKGGMTGVETGLSGLDDLTRGLKPGQLIFVGARPAEGKTTLALNIAGNMGKRGVPIGFFSLEMDSGELSQKLIVRESGLSGQGVKSGFLKQTDFSRLSQGAGVVHDMPLYIYDQPGATMAEIRSRGKFMVRKHGVKAIFIDYIGLITGSDTRQPRHEQIAQIARDMKILARQLQVPVIVPAQVRREAEDKRGKGIPPGMRDLAESSEIEKSADIIMFIHTVEKIDGGGFDIGANVDLIIAKHRGGATGKIPLYFNMDRQLFTMRE